MDVNRILTELRTERELVVDAILHLERLRLRQAERSRGLSKSSSDANESWCGLRTDG